MRSSSNFTKQHYEREFEKTILESSLKCFKSVLGTLFLQSLCIFAFDPLKIGHHTVAFISYLVATTIFLLTAFLLVMRKYQEKNSLFTALAILLFIIGTQELTMLRGDNTSEENRGLASKQNLELASLIILTSHLNWGHKVIIFLLVNVYGEFRLQIGRPFADSDKFHYISLIVQGFVLFSTLFVKAKEKATFCKFNEYGFQSMNIEQILKNFIACSIMIYRAEEILFFNEVTKNMFDVGSEGELKRVLNSIKFVRKIAFEDFKSFKFIPGQTVNDFTFSLEELINDWDRNLSVYGSGEARRKFINFEGELIIKEESQTPRCLFIQIGTCMWEEKPSLIIIINDMTSMKKHFKCVEEYKDNMLAKVSHNLRTPLNGILGNLELMMAEESNKNESFKVTYTSARLLLSIVNDIIDFSKISRRQFKLCPEAASINDLLEEVKDLFALQAEKKGLALNIESEVREQDYVLDRERLKQVLINLVGNAVKFTDEGCVWIRAREGSQQLPDVRNERKIIRSSKENDDLYEWKRQDTHRQIKVIFEVEDTGPGIMDSEMDDLFNLTSNFKSNEGQNLSEIGFGLPISQSLVSLMNHKEEDGEILVESKVGNGTKFSFPICVEKAQENNIVSKASQPFVFRTHSFALSKLNQPESLFTTNFMTEEEEFVSTKKKPFRVLIVDDDQINLMVASNFLKPDGKDYEYQTAMNGKQALEKVKSAAVLEKKYFDVFLMDCNMPVLDGYEASRELKSMMKTKTIPWAPIIAITANFGNADKEKCLSNGMDYFLTKPITRNQLLAKIREALLG